MEQFQEGLKELKDKFQSLFGILKCPVCSKTLDKDDVLCVNGHSICIDCRKDFSKCSHENCTELVKPEDDHELYCCYRTTACQVFDCFWDGPVKDLLNHFQEAHCKVMYAEKLDKILLGDFYPNKESKNVRLYSVSGHYLWQVRKNDPTKKLLTFTYIPVFNRKPTRDILVKCCLKARKMEYSITIRITMDVNVGHAKKNVISIPSSMLYNFWIKIEKKIYMSVSMTEAVD